MQLSLRLLLLVLVAALPVFALQVYNELEERQARRLEAGQALLERARLYAAQIDRFVEGARYLLVGLAQLPEVRGGDRAACSARMRAAAAQFPELTGAGTIDPDGVSRCSALGGEPVDLSDRPYFREAVEQKRFATSGYQIGRRTNRPSIVFAYPALDEDGAVLSVVVLAFSLESFSAVLAQAALSEGMAVGIVDRAGTIAARLPEPERWIGRQVEPARVAAMYRTRWGTLTGEGLDGVRRLYGFAPLSPPADMMLYVGLSEASILADADRQFWRAIGLIALTLLLALVAALLGGEFGIRRPVLALRDAVRRMAAGDLAARPAQKGGLAELAELAADFAEMGKALAAREAALRQALAEKEMLFKEVNHRVKNSLQMISSLLNLHVLEIRDPQMRRQFEEASARVATVARVHQRLYQSDRVDRVEFGQYLRELCEDLARSFVGGERHRLCVEAGDIVLPTDQAIPLALVVNELVTNAFKYAFPEDGGGEVRVVCRRGAGGGLELVVRDDGIGLPPDFAPEASAGLGMRIVVALVGQINGRLRLLREGRGAAFAIDLPPERSRQ